MVSPSSGRDSCCSASPFPPCCRCDGVIPQRPGASKRAYARGLGESLALAGAQVVLAVALLAHQAWLMADAIARTLVRLDITRRNLLEWVTAAQAGSRVSRTLGELYRRMWGGLALAGAAALVLVLAARVPWAMPPRWSPSGSSRRRWPGG